MITLKAPSFSRVFAVAFLGIAVAGLASLIATWQSARRTQAAMVVLTQRLEDLDRASAAPAFRSRSEEHTSELQSRLHLVCRLLLEKKNKQVTIHEMDRPLWQNPLDVVRQL